MKIFAAVDSVGRSKSSLATARRVGFRHVLVAFAEGEDLARSVVFAAHSAGVGVFLDSGAFSAFTRGARIDIGRYIAFAQAVGSLVDVVANLDVIGDPVATAANQRTMEAAGLAPLTTCHLGMDPHEVLDCFSAARRGALGGMAARGRTQRAGRAVWLDRVFSVLMASSAWPIAVHGYGMTDAVLVERYPWASVDSTSWVKQGAYGLEQVSNGRHYVVRQSVVIPQRGDGAAYGRVHRSAPKIVSFADYVTRLWRDRGVEWPS